MIDRELRLAGAVTPLAVAVTLSAAVVLTAGAAMAQAPTKAIRAQREIPEDSLLDVGIQIFDPGLPPGDSYVLEEDLIFEDIRKSEARHIPVRLMDTLQATGQWGAVRVVPKGTRSTDLVLRGKIVESTGRKLVLEMRAADSSGRQWLEKRYKQIADPRAYHDEEIDREPFQELFNQVANDLLAARDKLELDELRAVREISELKFAAELAPVAFEDYLSVDRKGRTVAVRLPAEDDAMMERIAQIRERDYLFIDTLTDHYANFEAQMREPYDNWRKFAYDEEMAQRKIQKKARVQKILGVLAILGGVMMDGSSREKQAVREVAVIGGAMAVRVGMSKSQEVKLHLEALRELASSFDSEVAPLLVDVEGQTMRLSGSIETQYVTWRQLMRDFFIAETGLPVDPDSGEPAAAGTPTDSTLE